MPERLLARLAPAVLSAVVAAPSAAFAQSYPTKPIRLVHGFAPGAAIDVFSRPIAQKLSEALGQSVVVEPRPGATGTIANDFISKQPPDGLHAARLTGLRDGVDASPVSDPLQAARLHAGHSDRWKPFRTRPEQFAARVRFD